MAVGLAALFGLAAARFVGGIPLAAVGLMIAVLPLLYVVTRGPGWALGVYVATYALGLYRYSIGFGPVNLRPTDAAYLGVLAWAWSARQRNGRATRRGVGQMAWFALLAVALLSLYPVWVDGTAAISGPGLAWARLAETLSLIWLMPYLVASARDIRAVLRIFTLALAAQVLIALAMVAADGGLPDRLRGWLDDPNALGLVAALLLVMAVHAPLSWPAWARMPLIVLALVCLPLTRSIASMAAAAITLGIFGLRARPSSRWQQETLLAPIRLLVLFAGVVGVITLVRGNDVPWSDNYDQSSASERVVLANAAAKIYVDHPVVGVGFTRSGAPEVVGDPALNDQLRRQFPNVPSDFFPDVNPSHVHNAYLEVLADTGTAGGICLVLVLIGTWRGVRGAMGQRGPELDRRLARASAAGLMVLLIWCNDNAVFGGQIETASIGLLVGCIAASRPVRGRGGPPALAATDGARPDDAGGEPTESTSARVPTAVH